MPIMLMTMRMSMMKKKTVQMAMMAITIPAAIEVGDSLLLGCAVICFLGSVVPSLFVFSFLGGTGSFARPPPPLPLCCGMVLHHV